MVGSSSEHISSPDSGTVIRVPFPYADLFAPEDPVEPADSLPKTTVKIDYTAITVPPPKKTISIRRSSQETRLIRLEKSLNAPIPKPHLSEDGFTASKRIPLPAETAASDDELAETMQKLLKNVGTISLAAQESQRQYASIATSLEKQSTAIPKIEALQKHLDQSHKVETANQRLFDMMHTELKGYKDNFLFDALQKPVIRDLLAVFDDLCGQARRVARFLKENSSDTATKVNWQAELQASHDNLNNTVFFIVEVLNRLDVTMIDGENNVLDLKQHKVVGFDPTENSEEKNQIAKVIRPGFMWKERVLRPTEVLIKKYTPATLDDSGSE